MIHNSDINIQLYIYYYLLKINQCEQILAQVSLRRFNSEQMLVQVSLRRCNSEHILAQVSLRRFHFVARISVYM